MKPDNDEDAYVAHSFDDDGEVELVEYRDEELVRELYVVDQGEVIQSFSSNQPNVAIDFGEGYAEAKKRYSGESAGWVQRVIERLGL